MEELQNERDILAELATCKAENASFKSSVSQLKARITELEDALRNHQLGLPTITQVSNMHFSGHLIHGHSVKYS